MFLLRTNSQAQNPLTSRLMLLILCAMVPGLQVAYVLSLYSVQGIKLMSKTMLLGTYPTSPSARAIRITPNN